MRRWEERQGFQLPVLTELNLDDNLVTDVTALGTLNALSLLHLNRNQVQDVSPLVALSQLTNLGLSNNRIGAPLGSSSGLAKLATLDLSDNSVRELTPLLRTTWPSGAGRSATLVLTGNPLDCTAQGSNLQALNTKGVAIVGCP